MSATFCQGCMGLPQELIDYIMDMLCGDTPALKACSLTCKAMFASTRHLIHQRLRLPTCEKLRVLALAEKSRPQGWDSSDGELRPLSYMTELGILQYTRGIHISLASYTALNTIPPHLHHLQSLNLNRVHTLSISEYHAPTLEKCFKPFFIHSYPNVTSLTLTRAGVLCHRDLLRFALQFPLLQNLCVEWTEYVKPEQNSAVPTTARQSPPLRGHLRLARVDVVAMDFTHELPNGINFRSVELEEFSGDDAQRVLNMCARTLQNFTVAPRGSGTGRFSFLLSGMKEPLAHFLATGHTAFHGLGFTEHTVLRRLTLRVAAPDVPIFSPTPLLSALSTITSHTFCEFVLELPRQINRLALCNWSGWEEIDEVLEEQFATRRYFRFIIRTGRFWDQESFRKHTKGILPLLASRGLLCFENF